MSAFFKSIRFGVIGFLAILHAGSAAIADVIYVRASATGSNNGTSWTNAYNSLQSALGAAQSGDQIWVAAGTYKPAGPSGPRTASFSMISGVEIYGGFAGTESQLSERNVAANVTTLSGDLNGNDTQFSSGGDNSYHVVRAFAVVDGILDGFTIRQGNGRDGGVPPALERNGGGLLIRAAD